MINSNTTKHNNHSNAKNLIQTLLCDMIFISESSDNLKINSHYLKEIQENVEKIYNLKNIDLSVAESIKTNTNKLVMQLKKHLENKAVFLEITKKISEIKDNPITKSQIDLLFTMPNVSHGSPFNLVKMKKLANETNLSEVEDKKEYILTKLEEIYTEELENSNSINASLVNMIKLNAHQALKNLSKEQEKSVFKLSDLRKVIPRSKTHVSGVKNSIQEHSRVENLSKEPKISDLQLYNIAEEASEEDLNISKNIPENPLDMIKVKAHKPLKLTLSEAIKRMQGLKATAKKDSKFFKKEQHKITSFKQDIISLFQKKPETERNTHGKMDKLEKLKLTKITQLSSRDMVLSSNRQESDKYKTPSKKIINTGELSTASGRKSSKKSLSNHYQDLFI